MGVLAGHSYANSLFHGVSGSVRRAGRMAIHEALLAGGAIFGATLGGFTYQHYDTIALYTGCALFLFALAAVQALLVFRQSKSGASAGRML